MYHQIQAGLSNRRILVVGDLMLDHYVRGGVHRISPEAPVPIVEVNNETFLMGGAANVAHNLVSVGANVSVLSVLGVDADGRRLLDLLDNADIDTSGIALSPERLTTTKTRILAAYESKVFQQMLRLDRELINPLSDEDSAFLQRFLQDNWSKFDAIVLSDYNKGILNEVFLENLRLLSAQSPKIITVDPKSTSFHKYRNFTILTPNQQEAERVIGCSLNSEERLVLEGEKLRQSLGLSALLITLGKKGMMLFVDHQVIRIDTEAREVFDVTGAGDTVISFLSLGLCLGLNYGQAARLANLAAGIVVGKIGAATVSKEEFQWICKQLE